MTSNGLLRGFARALLEVAEAMLAPARERGEP